MDTQYTSILKRVGTVLLIVGLIDIAVMIYCIANRISYSSSFNIFAVVAGVFLMRGSLRTASIVRWFSVFMLACFSSLLLAWPFMQPMNLTLAQFRLYPGSLLATAALMVFVLGLLAWVTRELGRKPIKDARANAGKRERDMRIPAGVGVGLVVFLTIVLPLLLDGESANRAKVIAEQQIGSSYRFHVTSLNIAKNNQGTFVSAIVTAWNDNEIRKISVHWEEH